MNIGQTYGQKKKISFQNTPFVEVLQQIEQAQITPTFNYAPDLVQEFIFTGVLDLEQDNYLNKLLYDTNLDFEIHQKSILLFVEEKKDWRICGTIIDQEFKSPLAFATIISDDHLAGTQSNEQGFFDFSCKAYKNQTIQISYLGYQSKRFDLRKLQDCPKIYLEIDGDLLGQEIIVTDYLLDGITEGAAYSEVEMNYDQLSKSHSVVEHDILKTTQFLPGITSIDESASNIQIRGGTADQNLILWEGNTIYNPGHFFGMISAINPFVVDKVEVYKGVFDPRFDNRVGGIIDMSLQDSISTQIKAGAGSTLSESHAYLDVPLLDNTLSILASGRHSLSPWLGSPTIGKYADKVFQATRVSDQQEDVDLGFLDAEQFQQFYDWNAKLIFRPTKRMTFKTGYFTSSNQFNYDATIFEERLFTRDDVYFQTIAFNASLAVQVSPKWETTFAFVQSYYQNDYNFIFIEEEEPLYSNSVFNDIDDQSWKWENRFFVSPSLSFQLGYDYNYKDVNFNFFIEEEDEPDYEDMNFVEAHFHNAYGAFNYEKKNLRIDGGLRLTYYQEEERAVASPRLNLQYALRPHLKLKAATGVFYQFISQLQQFGENDLGVDNPVWIISRTETDSAQKANKLSAGLVYHHKGWLLDVEAYRHYISGLNTINPIFNSSVNLFEEFETGSSESIGLDVLFKKRWNPYTIWFNYSLSRVKFFFPTIVEDGFAATNDQRHNFSIVNSFKYKSWNFALSGQYRTGLPYSVPVGIMGMYNDLYFENFNNYRLADYIRLDFNIHYRFGIKDTRLKGEFSASIVNLFNRTNPFSREYFVEDDEEIASISFVEKGLLQRTPSVLIRFYW